MEIISKEQADKLIFVREKETDTIFEVINMDIIGQLLFTFDKKKIYNLFVDYPMNFSEKEREIFAKEKPYWANFFKDRF